MIDHALRRSSNISWHKMSINKKTRSELNSQKPCVVWFTGLSGSGKSTIANILEQKLHTLGKRTYLLDGDNVRHGLNKDLGFTDTDRVENIRRVAEVSKLMVDAGLITLVAFISPFKSERQMARNLLSSDEFFEIFVNTSLEECEKREVGPGPGAFAAGRGAFAAGCDHQRRCIRGPVHSRPGEFFAAE